MSTWRLRWRSPTQGRYASAFVLVRTALEQEALDRLLMLGRRFVELVRNVDDQAMAVLEAELEAGDASWTADVERLERRGSSVAVIRGPHRVVNSESNEVVEHLSHYYMVLEQHDPTLGPPRAQSLFDDGLTSSDERAAWARRNQSLYAQFLRWTAIGDNLVLNNLATEREVLQLDVHYRFLSSFTHASREGYQRIERLRGHPGFGRATDHVLGELVLLYAICVAAAELHTFTRFVDGRPKIQLVDADEVDRLLAEAEDVAGYFWFSGGRPADYDRYQEANRLAWRARERGGPVTVSRAPQQLSDEEVSYYRDPLERLRAMHDSVQEMTTGLVYVPPW